MNDQKKTVSRCTSCGGDLDNYSGPFYDFYGHLFCEVCMGQSRGHFVQVMVDRIAKLEALLAKAQR